MTNHADSNEPVKFIRDVIWVGMSQLFTSLLGIVTLPALTKAFTTQDYGIWAQVSATVGLIVPLLTLQFGSAVVRFLAGEKDRDLIRRSLGVMLTAILLFASVLIVLTNLAAPEVSSSLFASPTLTAFVELTFVWTLIDAVYTMFIAYLRARGEIRKLSVIQVSFSSAKVVGIVVMAGSGFSLVWIIMTMILIESLFSVILLAMVIRDTGLPVLGFAGINRFLVFSIPQIPSGILLWIISTSDRYFITHFLDLSNTGVYATSSSLGGLLSLFWAPVSFVLLPVVSKAWEQNDIITVKNYFEYSTKLFLTLAVPAAAAITILSQALLRILATSAYLAGWGLVLLISTGIIFLGIYQINLYIMYLVKKTKWLPLLIVAASLTSVVMNIILIPRVGIMGAGISTLASYFVLATAVTVWARKTINYNIDLKYLAKVVAASLVMVAGIYLLKLNGAMGIILSMIAGVLIFAAMMFLLRAVTAKDAHHVRRILSGLFRGTGATAPN